MAYVELNDIISKLPMNFIIEALDDDGDGVVDDDVWSAIANDIDDEIDGYLGTRYTVPFSPVPRIIYSMARVFALDALYRRRGFFTQEHNPYHDLAIEERKTLKRLAMGEEQLFPGSNTTKRQSVIVISEPSRTHSKHGNLSN
jgi:phage gp36-like protein